MKSDYSKESITEFLSRKYGEDIRLFPIKEGQESQAYWFSRGGREYVVRINSNMEGFKKDKYAYEHFRSDRVPIPEVVETGNFDGTHYFCISVKADGITYEDSDEETVVRLLGDITDVTEAISRTDISGTSGCGVFDSDTGNAPFYSWREYLAEVFERDWTAVSRSYVNLSLIDELLAAYRELISYCPEERALFHGDFGSNNVIVGKKIEDKWRYRLGLRGLRGLSLRHRDRVFLADMAHVHGKNCGVLGEKILSPAEIYRANFML